MQCHFGGDLRQALHQEVSCAHPHLQRAERMLHRLASLTHFLWVFVEPALHRFYNMFMLPARDLAVLPVVRLLLMAQYRQALVQ